jgi:hypothetical protein
MAYRTNQKHGAHMSAMSWFGYSPIDVLTALLVIITAIYAGLTFSIAKSNRAMVERVSQQIEAQTRPIVTVNTEIHHHTVFTLRIWNSGASPAENLILSIDRDFFRFGRNKKEESIKELHIFSNIISTLAPQDGYWVDLCTGPEVGKESDGVILTPEKFIVSAKYSYGGKSYSENFFIDLKSYFFTSGEKRAVEQMDKIAKSLDDLNRNFNNWLNSDRI